MANQGNNFQYQVGGSAGKFTPPVHRSGQTGGAQRSARPVAESPPILGQQPADLPRPGGRVSQDDVIYFATQLAVMVDTGVPLSEALESIAKQTESGGMAALAGEICEEIKEGTEFSASLASRPRVFGNLFPALVKASEASGKMGLMLQRVSEYMQEERETRKKVKGALVYPAFMLVFCALVVVGMMIFILPRFAKIYAGKGVILPAPTRILMGISAFMISYWWAILATLAVAVVGGWWFLRTPAGQTTLDSLKLHVPIIGGMTRKSCLARCLRAMATMTSAGVSVLDMLAITAQVAGNSIYAGLWKRLADGVEQGSSLAEIMTQEKLVPRTITQMISAGERTGRLAMVMDRVAGFCESDLRVAVKSATNMIEPVMIIIMGAVIGAIALALLLPVFSISKVVAG